MTRDGFLPVYKPLGLTSQQTVLQVKKVCGGKKAGHTGTLDPAAEGLLLVAIGKATRLSEYFLSGEKGYRAQIFFGSSTDTGDREGKVIAQVDEFVLQPKEIEKVLSQFQGSILQVPPGASAVKIKGSPFSTCTISISGLETMSSPLSSAAFSYAVGMISLAASS